MLVETCITLIVVYALLKLIRFNNVETITKNGVTMKLSPPPGPFQWPLVGNIPQIAAANSEHPHLAFSKIADQYGDVVTLKFGVHPMVLLSSYEAIRDLLGKEEFHGRYDGFPYVTDRSYKTAMGIIFTSGDEWRAMRRFTVRVLRDFGFGKRNSMGVTMSEEMDDFSMILESKSKVRNGVIQIVPELFSLSYINILWSYVAGYRFSQSDSRLPDIFRLNDDVIHTWNTGNWTAPFPVLKYLLPGSQHVTSTAKVYNALHDFTFGLIKDVQAVYEKESPGNPRTFIEAFLQEISEAKEQNGAGVGSYFGLKQLNMVLQDLFIGGSETSSNTTAYAILFMALHPEIQARVHSEIEQHPNSSSSSVLSLSDLVDMPNTQATIEEIFRCSNIVPVINRKVMDDYVYRDKYIIRKGTLIFANFSAVRMDAKFWGDPETFRPERFLDASGTKLVNTHTERVLPFGSGKRVCIAESMARESFALFFAALLKKYKFQLPSDGGGKSPRTDPVPMFTLRPHPFDVLITLRSS